MTEYKKLIDNFNNQFSDRITVLIKNLKEAVATDAFLGRTEEFKDGTIKALQSVLQAMDTNSPREIFLRTSYTDPLGERQDQIDFKDAAGFLNYVNNMQQSLEEILRDKSKYYTDLNTAPPELQKAIITIARDFADLIQDLKKDDYLIELGEKLKPAIQQAQAAASAQDNETEQKRQTSFDRFLQGKNIQRRSK